MFRLKKILFLSFVLILSSCNNEQKEGVVISFEPKVIPVLDSKIDHEGLPFFDEIDIITLETNATNLMAGCDWIEEYKNELYILDKKFSNLFVFDTEGNFIRKIGGLGSGPGQFQSIYGFSLDRNQGQVLIYSLDNQAVFKYDVNGEFLDKTKIDFYGYDFILSNNNEYIFNVRYNDNGEYSRKNIFFTDRSGRVQNSLFSYPKEATTMVMTLSGFLCLDNRNGYYNNAFSDTVYSFDLVSKIAKPHYIFDLGKNHWSYGFDFTKMYQKDFMSSNYISSMSFTSESLLFFGFFESEIMKGKESRGLTPKMGVLDMNTDIVYTSNNLPNEFMFKYFSGFPKGRSESGKYLSSISAGQVDLIKRNYSEAWAQSKLWYPLSIGILETITEEENNPVIIKYSLRR